MSLKQCRIENRPGSEHLRSFVFILKSLRPTYKIRMKDRGAFRKASQWPAKRRRDPHYVKEAKQSMWQFKEKKEDARLQKARGEKRPYLTKKQI
jgi:hypothetical protein